MRDLIVSTLARDDDRAAAAIDKLCGLLGTNEVIYTEQMDIRGCIGCNYCWLKTPGVCAIQDDYIEILKKMKHSDRVIFVSKASLGFVHHELKDVIDRVLPLAVMYMKVTDGQIRHRARYGKAPDMALLIDGEPDMEFLEHWLSRVALNLGARSLGVYGISDGKELCNALADN